MADTNFCLALERGDLNALRRCAKGDLHNHMILGGDREYLRARTGRDIPPITQPLSSMADMHAWVEAAVGNLFEGAAGRLLAIEAALMQARKDGVVRMIYGEDVWAITHYDGSAEALTQALRELHARIAPDIQWIPELGLSRHCPVSALENWIAPFLELGFYRSLDLYGDELAQPVDTFTPIYRRAKAAGLRLRAHVGEWGTAEDVWRAVETLELDEVQHGIAATESPEIMRRLSASRVQLNICPTSNLLLGLVKNFSQHPIRKLYDAGVRVTVNTDDVLAFGNGVSEEFLALYKNGLFTAAELDDIRRNALDTQQSPDRRSVAREV